MHVVVYTRFLNDSSIAKNTVMHNTIMDTLRAVKWIIINCSFKQFTFLTSYYLEWWWVGSLLALGNTENIKEISVWVRHGADIGSQYRIRVLILMLVLGIEFQYWKPITIILVPTDSGTHPPLILSEKYINK